MLRVTSHSAVSLNDYEGPFLTPILIVFWRRPQPVMRLIARIKPLQPATLFLACDGPREGNEDEALQVTRSRHQVEDAIDWPCSIQKRYSDINRGVKYGPYEAIEWFFASVDHGIIFEDDCLPETSFLPFCAAMLERFRDDERIWQVTGNNFVPSSVSSSSSYFFSMYPSTWGWASWRRCWRLYDIKMSSWREVRDSGLLVNAFETGQELDYWTTIWNNLVDYNYPLAWDYQWIYACIINRGLCIVPRSNLVSNIGFGSDGTNCLSAANSLANLPTVPIDFIHHPQLLLPNRSYDRAMQAVIRAADVKSAPHPLKRFVLIAYFTAKGIIRKLLCW